MQIVQTVPFALALIVSICAEARADEVTPAETSRCAEAKEEQCYLSAARALVDSGKLRDAIALLKEGLAAHPESAELTLLLIDAYQRDGNDMWALRTAADFHARHLDDCEVASWIAWIYLKQGTLDEARELLAPMDCGQAHPLAARRELLLSFIEKNAKDDEAAQGHLDAAYAAKSAFAEDKEAIGRLMARDPGYLAPVSGRVDLALGYTANALAGSPLDPAATEQDTGSPLGQVGGWLRLVGPTGRWLRPAAELDVRTLGLTSKAGRDLSYLLLGGRPGVIVGWLPNALLGYRYEGLLIAGGDQYDAGPLWFYHAHRGEIEASVLPSLTVFGGAGRRLFREVGRSRTEVDGGLGGHLNLGAHVRLLGALTGRWHLADKAPYDLWGGSALVSADVRLPKGWSARAGVILGFDDYPHSAGYFDAARAEVERRDMLLKLSASAFTPQLTDNLRLAVTYEFAERFSTTEPYRYRDHRILGKLQWSFSFDPWLPRAVAPENHVALDYGLGSVALEESVQDLLRQDEAAQRSSSCVK